MNITQQPAYPFIVHIFKVASIKELCQILSLLVNTGTLNSIRIATQKKTAIDAGRIASLNVMQNINDPSAAPMAYVFEQREIWRQKMILVLPVAIFNWVEKTLIAN